MHLSKTITILIFLTASISKVYASSDFYMGAEYVYDVIKINRVDDIVTEDFPFYNLQLSETARKSYESGGVHIAYKLHSNFSIEMAYAQSQTKKIL